MIILDSDHLSMIQHPESPQYQRLTERMKASSDTEFATTAVTLEEQMRGWLAAINRAPNVYGQLLYYTRLTGLVDFFAFWRTLPFDEPAADRFTALRSRGIRVGTMDLKIASIALHTDSLLLTANLRDFEKIPGLRLENWLA